MKLLSVLREGVSFKRLGRKLSISSKSLVTLYEKGFQVFNNEDGSAVVEITSESGGKAYLVMDEKFYESFSEGEEINIQTANSFKQNLNFNRYE